MTVLSLILRRRAISLFLPPLAIQTAICCSRELKRTRRLSWLDAKIFLESFLKKEGKPLDLEASFRTFRSVVILLTTPENLPAFSKRYKKCERRLKEIEIISRAKGAKDVPLNN